MKMLTFRSRYTLLQFTVLGFCILFYVAAFVQLAKTAGTPPHLTPRSPFR